MRKTRKERHAMGRRHRGKEMQRGETNRDRETEGEKKRGKERLGEREHTLYSPLIIVEPPYSKYC